MCPELVEDKVLFNLVPELGPLLPLLGEYVASDHRVLCIRLKLCVKKQRTTVWGGMGEGEGKGKGGEGDGVGKSGGAHIQNTTFWLLRSCGSICLLSGLTTCIWR